MDIFKKGNVRDWSMGDIDIDGNLNEWSEDETYLLSVGSADSVQGDFPSSDVDLSADFRMRWWNDYLFIGAAVNDDVVMEGDSLQLSFDVDGDSKLSDPDFTLRVWHDGRITVNGRPGGDVLAVGKTSDKGYVIEMAIPANMLGGDFSPKQKLHFNYGILDFDATDNVFDTAMNWQGASVSGIRADFGWLELTPVSLLIKSEYNDPRFQDTFINEWSPDTNYDRSPTMRIRVDDIESPLVRFDASSIIPKDAQLTYAILGIYTVQDRENADLTAHIYRMLRPWVAGEATWKRPAANQSWELPGAKGQTDQMQTQTDEQRLNPAGADGNCRDRNATWFDVTKDMREFIAGRVPNYGWVLRGEAGAQINYSLGTSQNQNPDCRPEMYFEYTFPSGALPTPTPTFQRLYLPLLTP